MATNRLVLLSGATGYTGGRLLKALKAQGTRVRCLARQPEFLRARVLANTEIVPADVLDSASLARAMRGVDTAYYLGHVLHPIPVGVESEAHDAQDEDVPEVHAGATGGTVCQ